MTCHPKSRSTARLFADDCLLYRTIKSNQDSDILQQDLDNLQKWESDWLMHFNPDKCEVIRITNKRRTINGTYTIHDQPLGHTNQAKYLGVTISNNLSWNDHIGKATKKANNTTAFLRRNLSSCPKAIKEKCYTTLVRPQVEYSATVWDPHTSANINELEAVQRRAARLVSSDYSPTSSVTSMLDRLGWESLEQRRQKAKVVMMYRIVHSLIAIPSTSLLQPLGAATRGHSYRYRTPYTRTTTYRESFYPSGIRLWNQLPESVTCAKSLDSFKSGISSIVFWGHTPVFIQFLNLYIELSLTHAEFLTTVRQCQNWPSTLSEEEEEELKIPPSLFDLRELGDVLG